MLFYEPERTQFDLQWRMFGTYVRVHPMFWLLGIILGWNWTRNDGLLYLAVWILCVFVSILLHEFGHIWMGQLFGSQGYVLLHGMGGLAIGIRLDNRWKRIAVSFAGPLIQLVLLGVIIGIAFALPWLGVQFPEAGEAGKLLHKTLGFLVLINLFWPLLNLLPIWPLDGGQMVREFLDWLAPEQGVRISLGISLVTAGLLAINALVPLVKPGAVLIPYLPTGGILNVILFGILALGSFQALQAENANRPPWEREG